MNEFTFDLKRFTDIANAEDFTNVLNVNDGTITLTDNITLDETAGIFTNVTIDLNGHEISTTAEDTMHRMASVQTPLI
ncbi:MAG: hypothetical protein IJK81_04735 [Selenomonadaceae bacterium]|nr:hypothetical protein [Selenomonadaceae bacterium]